MQERAHTQRSDWEQTCQYYSSQQLVNEEANLDNNHIQKAENLWEMAKELGFTVGFAQRNHLKQIIEMEERDTKEAERLGSRRRTP